MIGYPLIIYIEHHDYFYWTIAVISIISLVIVIVNKEGDKLTHFKYDKNMEISITNIAFRRVKTLCNF